MKEGARIVRAVAKGEELAGYLGLLLLRQFPFSVRGGGRRGRSATLAGLLVPLVLVTLLLLFCHRCASSRT